MQGSTKFASKFINVMLFFKTYYINTLGIFSYFIDSKEIAIVGVNKYSLVEDEEFSFLEIDNDLVRKNQISRLKTIKTSLENLSNPEFVRMTGSGSALVAYFQSKSRCENAKRMFNKKYKNYWCITSKTI